jgi:hypothetical protein
MTNAACISMRLQGLLNSQNFNLSVQLQNCLVPLRERGEKLFSEAMQIVGLLSREEAEMFWKLQERNRGVTSFHQLVTKKHFQEAQKIPSSS